MKTPKRPTVGKPNSMSLRKHHRCGHAQRSPRFRMATQIEANRESEVAAALARRRRALAAGVRTNRA